MGVGGGGYADGGAAAGGGGGGGRHRGGHGDGEEEEEEERMELDGEGGREGGSARGCEDRIREMPCLTVPIKHF